MREEVRNFLKTMHDDVTKQEQEKVADVIKDKTVKNVELLIQQGMIQKSDGEEFLKSIGIKKYLVNIRSQVNSYSC